MTPYPLRWLRSRPRAVLRSVAILAPAGAGVLILGALNDGPDTYLERHGFLTNVLSSAGTGALGVALALLVISEVTERRNRDRSREEAVRAAGELVGELMALHLRLFAPEFRSTLPLAWRARSRVMVARLVELRTSARTVSGAAATLKRRIREADDGDAVARTMQRELGAAQREWERLLEPGDRELWRAIGYTWGILEGDVRTRLLAAQSWLPRSVAIRMTELVRQPDDAVRGELLYHLHHADLDPQEAVREMNGYVHTEFRQAPPPGEEGREHLHGGVELLRDFLEGCRHYLDRLLMLTVQLEELALRYPPPATEDLGSEEWNALGSEVGVRLPEYMLRPGDYRDIGDGMSWSFEADDPDSIVRLHRSRIDSEASEPEERR